MRSLHRFASLLAAGSLLMAAAQLAAGLNAPPPMTFQKLTPNMMVEDVNTTIDFYRDVLGFELVVNVPEEGAFDFALVRRDGVEVMFQSRASLAADLPAFAARPAGGALTFFYLDVEGVEALYEQLRTRTTVVKDLHETFYGTREFAVEDCNGFILAFAEGGE